MLLSGTPNADQVVKYVQESDLPFCLEAIRKRRYNPEKAMAVLSINWTEKYFSRQYKFDAMELAIVDAAPALSSIRCYKGLEFTLDFLLAILTDFVAWFNVPQGMTTSQVDTTAQIIFEDYHYLKVSEIKYILERGKRQMQTHGSIDGRKILQLFVDYDAGRTGHSSAESLSNHIYLTEPEKRVKQPLIGTPGNIEEHRILLNEYVYREKLNAKNEETKTD